MTSLTIDSESDRELVLSQMNALLEVEIPLSAEQRIGTWALFTCQVWHSHDIETCVPENIVLGEN